MNELQILRHLQELKALVKCPGCGKIDEINPIFAGGVEDDAHCSSCESNRPMREWIVGRVMPIASTIRSA